MSDAFETLVDADTLHRHVGDASWRVLDCRFALDDLGRGRRLFGEATIPGAIYAHLEDDLSGAIVPGRTGRHPLPSPDALADTFGRWGIDDGTQVVAFDDVGGGFAARLWWSLRWLGHRRAAVLDGGLAAWSGRGFALAPGTGALPPATPFEGRPNPDMVADANAVASPTSDTLVDARAPARFSGEDEPIDPVGGHIPGAINLPWRDNLGPDGTFLPAATLRERFAALGPDPAAAICYCGSGVTACHDLLAAAHAGLPIPRLYPGSWSEWIVDPNRPRAR